MLDLDPNRPVVAPRPAASVLVLRDGEGRGGRAGVEVLCLVRGATRFLSGAVAFPGGRVDPDDATGALDAGAPPDPRAASFADEATPLGALLVAARRETLEEAGLAVDPAALVPVARWVTPRAEARRYDARFFAVVVGRDAAVQGDDREAASLFWATPEAVLAREAAGDVQLAPPTWCLLAGLAGAASADDALARARQWSLEPVCPELVPHADAEGETSALALPGDPAHPAAGPRVLPDATRFVLRDGRFVPGRAP